MKDRFKEVRETTVRNIFKKLYLRDKLSCPICPPNKGCNARKKRKEKSWKSFRKTDEKICRIEILVVSLL